MATNTGTKGKRDTMEKKIRDDAFLNGVKLFLLGEFTHIVMEAIAKGPPPDDARIDMIGHIGHAVLEYSLGQKRVNEMGLGDMLVFFGGDEEMSADMEAVRKKYNKLSPGGVAGSIFTKGPAN